VLPSLLAQRFGFPFANLGMPAGNSRTLYTLLMSVFARTSRRPAAVVHFSGGDYSTFCKTSTSDSVFGSPGRHVLEHGLSERGAYPNADKHLPSLLAFSSLWTSAIIQACRSYGVPIVLGHDTTFFEKRQPSDTEREFALGRPTSDAQRVQFANHRKFGDAFYGRRKEVAEQLNVPLAGWGRDDAMTFVDEFHIDANGMRLLCDTVGDRLEPLLNGNRAKAELSSAE
jgi:hypothetical protein